MLHRNHFLRGLLLLGLLLNQDLLSLMLVKNLLGARVTPIGDGTRNGSRGGFGGKICLVIDHLLLLLSVGLLECGSAI